MIGTLHACDFADGFLPKVKISMEDFEKTAYSNQMTGAPLDTMGVEKAGNYALEYNSKGDAIETVSIDEYWNQCGKAPVS